VCDIHPINPYTRTIQKDGQVYRSGCRRTGYSTGQDTERRTGLQVRIQHEMGYSTGQDTEGRARLQARVLKDWLVYMSGYRRKGLLYRSEYKRTG
jgi:hypothetical protein